MKATAAAIALLVAVLVAGCGGTSHSGPPTFAHLADWLEEADECGPVEAEVTHLPVPKAHTKEVPPINLRFAQASVAAVAGCNGPNGYISYYRFPSAKARADAVRGREGLLSNELFCAHGPELVVNGLLGYDNTAPFCQRLGFRIHRPTRRYSAAQKLAHNLRFRAADLIAHVTGVPSVNLECEHTDRPLKFECQDIIGAAVIEIELVKKRGRYVIKGCEDLGIHRTDGGFRGETCALPSRHR